MNDKITAAQLLGDMTPPEIVSKLLGIIRQQYLTLGYYGTPYNYDSKNNVYHPISGEVASGIMWEGGFQARESSAIVKEYFGDDPVEAIDMLRAGLKEQP